MATKQTNWLLQLTDKITGPLGRITRSTQASTRQLTELQGKLEGIRSRTSSLQGTLLKLTAGAAVFGGLAAGTFQFERAMAKSNTMANLNKQELAGVTDQIRDIAGVVPLARTQLAEGLYNVVSAGVPKDNWIQFLEDSAKAAKGGFADLGTVVDSTASVIKTYKMGFDQANTVQDKFQKTVNLGQIPSLEALASALPRSAVLASQLGVNMDELLGTFSAASGPMGSVSEVSTQLRSTFAALLKPTSEATEMANQLGISFGADSIRKAGGLAAFLDELRPKIQAFSQKTGMNQEEVIGRLFGSQEAIVGVMGLMNQVGDAMKNNTAEMANSAGAVDEAFKKATTNPIDQLILLKNQFQNAFDGVVEVLKPVFNAIIGGLGSIIGFFQRLQERFPVFFRFGVIIGAAAFGIAVLSTVLALAWFKMQAFWLSTLKAAISGNFFTRNLAKAGLAVLNFGRRLLFGTFNLLRMAFGFGVTAVTAVGSFVAGLITAAAAQWGLNIAMNANPIGLIVLGVMTLIGVIALMVKYWDVVKIALYETFKFILKWNPMIIPIRAIIWLLDNLFPGFIDGIKNMFGKAVEFALGVWAKIKDIWNEIKALFGFGDDGQVQVDATAGAAGALAGADNTGLLPDQVSALGDVPGISGPGGGATADLTGVGGGKGGGTKRNVTVNIDKLVGEIVFNTSNIQESAERMAEKVKEVLVRAVRDSEVAISST